MSISTGTSTVTEFLNWFTSLSFKYQFLAGTVLFAFFTAWIPGINFLGIGAVTAAILFIIFAEV